LESTKPDLNSPIWYPRSQGDSFIQIRIRRSTFIAAIVSLLVHLLALFALSQSPREANSVGASQQPIEVRLTLPTPRQAESVAPTKLAQKPKVKSSAAVHLATSSKPITVPQEPSSSKPAIPLTPAPASPPNAAPPTDMLSYINATRERRRQAEENAARENAAAPSEAEARMANLKHNLQPQGTNGIFQILSMDSRTAMFSFRGWKNEFSNSRREVYQVDVELNGDLRREIIRKMIEIIRRYYTGNFNWDSYRLQRVVILSARPEDNAGLEDFMMQEFFER
jgi:outer membrane biosynthesis protein TonB